VNSSSLLAMLNVNNQDNQQSNEDDLLLTMFSTSNGSTSIKKPSGSATSSQTVIAATNMQATRYIANQPICNQSMFISSVLHYLKSMNMVDYHLAVLNLVKNALPSCGNSLKSISTYLIEQLCRNLLYITNGGLSTSGSSASSTNYIIPIIAYMSSVSLSINIPDLVVSMLKQLSFLLHYSLVYTTSPSFTLTQSIMNFYDPSTSSSSSTVDTQFKLFRQFQADNELNQTQTKECIMHLLPSILSSMVQVWQRCNLLLNSNNIYGVNFMFESQTATNSGHQYSWILGHPATIKQCITDMLNPIAQSHGLQFMMALGNVWGERRKKSRVYQEHKIIIELVKSCKSFPISVIMQHITEVLKQSTQNNKEKVSNKNKVKNNYGFNHFISNLFFLLIEKESSQHLAASVLTFLSGLSFGINKAPHGQHKHE
jgi:hypothetical protein